MYWQLSILHLPDYIEQKDQIYEHCDQRRSFRSFWWKWSLGNDSPFMTLGSLYFLRSCSCSSERMTSWRSTVWRVGRRTAGPWCVYSVMDHCRLQSMGRRLSKVCNARADLCHRIHGICGICRGTHIPGSLSRPCWGMAMINPPLLFPPSLSDWDA